eukprot:TRINITY_DN2959_c0_g2_i1.p1 TRINITY_DN2959_c0_g2~~TRINITY_DN2959_c0_g2_i1.p1  ORF type:complete len:110 (-),score=14.27 TRINITY_DN2959_c0_g2_i1:60-389(-)
MQLSLSTSLEIKRRRTKLYSTHFLKMNAGKDCERHRFMTPRYCLVRIRNQICLVNWSPDAATTRSRLLFHASLESVKLRLGNVVQLVVEVADEVDQMTEDALLENAEKA